MDTKQLTEDIKPIYRKWRTDPPTYWRHSTQLRMTRLKEDGLLAVVSRPEMRPTDFMPGTSRRVPINYFAITKKGSNYLRRELEKRASKKK